MRPPWPLLAAALALAVFTVWERAAIVHTGAEVQSLRARQARLAEERLALRMGLARVTSPGRLAGGREARTPWVLGSGRTPEAIERARADRR